MTTHECIERFDRLLPNAFPEKTKLSWLSEVDGKISRELKEYSYPVVYVYPRDLPKHLLAPTPYDAMYHAYLSAMVYLHNGEYTAYNTLAALFNRYYTDYTLYLKKITPKQAKKISVTI